MHTVQQYCATTPAAGVTVPMHIFTPSLKKTEAFSRYVAVVQRCVCFSIHVPAEGQLIIEERLKWSSLLLSATCVFV